MWNLRLLRSLNVCGRAIHAYYVRADSLMLYVRAETCPHVE